MKKMTNIFSKIKNVNDQLFLNSEKITIVDQNKVLIQNYNEIKEIQDEIIQLSKITIRGSKLKINSISKYFIEISGIIQKVELGEINYD